MRPFRNQPYSSVDIHGRIYGHCDYATNPGGSEADYM